MTDTTTKTTPWYDTLQGVENALHKGLGGLKELAAARGEAGYKREERMAWWCVLGHFVFDACGNTMVITEKPPTYDDFGKAVPRVFGRGVFDANVKHSVTMTFGSIPPTVDTCPRCLDGWSLQNAKDHKATQDSDVWTHYHQSCHDLMVLQNEVACFDKILEDALGDGNYETRLVPTCYPDRPTAPWFMVDTIKGTIKIGYRRSVISISWNHAEALASVNGDVLFKGEQVTTGETLVHAWGRDKAVEYLKRLMA